MLFVHESDMINFVQRAPALVSHAHETRTVGVTHAVNLNTYRPSIAVLAQMRGTPLAVIDLDPSSDGDEEQAVLSTYMQAWWSDPDVVPEMIDTEMATLLVSFKGSKLK